MRTFKGTIYEQDAKEYNLPEHCEMIAIGYWVGARGRQVTSWVFANGSYPKMQFSKDRHNVFYLEAIG